MGYKFLKFHVKVWYIFGIIGNAAGILNAISQFGNIQRENALAGTNIFGEYLNVLYMITWLSLLLCALLLYLHIVGRSRLKMGEMNGYNINLVLQLVDIGGYLLTMVISLIFHISLGLFQQGDGVIASFLVGSIGIPLARIAFNIFVISYYVNRRHLFIKGKNGYSPAAEILGYYKFISKNPEQSEPAEDVKAFPEAEMPSPTVAMPAPKKEIPNQAEKTFTKTTPRTVSSTKRYCKYCGGLIDPVSKKCPGCGKQYFKKPDFLTKQFILIAIPWVLAIGFAISTLVLAISPCDHHRSLSSLQKVDYGQKSNSQQTVKVEEEKVSEQETSATSSTSSPRLFSEIAKKLLERDSKKLSGTTSARKAFITETDNRYHTDTCSEISGKKLTEITIDEARKSGYQFCVECAPF